ncbi:MAG TPA: nucleotidyltransferase family protein [Nitrososphaeraceae archaeon]|jgi:mannose-1-phosphate guanylyltransferase|nr:nucleotidyltransferase family protein [Nitrososphaeraceae archaeon]
MKAIILAGGLGTRLQPYTFFIPKPMLPLGNKPLLEHIIEWLKNDDNNFDDIIICVSYLHRTIEDYFEDGSRFGISIEYARSDRPLATAGQLLTAKRFIDDTFVCVYGDSIYEFPLTEMINEHDKLGAFISMALLSYKTRLKYGFIDVNGNSRVTAWDEKPEIKGLINVGCYVMEPEFIDLIPASNGYGMDDAVRKALDMKKVVNGYKIESGFIDIGDKKSYLQTYKKYVERLGKI